MTTTKLKTEPTPDFMYGRSLSDPKKLLQGSGSQGAFVRLDDISVLEKPAVKALLHEAVAQAEPPLPRTGVGHTIIKSISAKQRPRRPNTNQSQWKRS